ncbi:MAG TPA: response regulator transcription factor [Chloroflexota bacterium]
MQATLADILVADRDSLARKRLRDRLEMEGFNVREAPDAASLDVQLQRQLPHLVILDIQLPGLSGMELCRRIKRCGDIPIVVVSAIDDEDVKLELLDLFAEDYVVKPASYAEVAVRVRCVLRRTWLSTAPVSVSVRVDERLSLDFLRREARTPAGTCRLTPMESRLLQLLVRNAGQVLPTELLLERIWGDTCVSANSLWEYVRRVRHKIGDRATQPRYIMNEPGLGYRFCRPATAEIAG